MKFKLFLLATCLTSLALPAAAHDAPRPALKPRVEGNLRAGTERTIAMTEFWVPFAQDPSSVIYGDARIMGDDDDNKEFNLGVGYREIVSDVPVLGKGVAGANVWLDRRLTERGSTFHQITTGAEWHGDVYDIKANAYIPLNKEETHGSGAAQSAPYLAGSGIFYDIVNNRVLEEAQPGLDLELGLNVSDLVDGFADSARVYAGAYHFEGDKSDSVTGWRTRVAADITPDVQLGARFQRDDQRGSQGFLEATIRFPFGNKQSYKQHGLYARLDESPERDIDIVTGSVTGAAAGGGAATQKGVPVLNATSGDPQRVLYVDNSAAGGGTGGIDSPFNTLAAAQAALADNDVIYVAHGDGTSTNMNTGFAINRSGVSLIGEGSAFVYDGGKFTTGGLDFTGTILKPAGLAPVITNVSNAALSGNGIYVTGANASISGVNVANAWANGIYAQAANTSLQNFTLSNVNSSNNGTGTAGRGVWVHADTVGNSIFDTVSLSNVTASNNNQAGIHIQSFGTGSQIAQLNMNTITANGNHTAADARGVYVTAQANGAINGVDLRNITASNNLNTGVTLLATNGIIGASTLDTITANNNAAGGLRFRVNGGTARLTSIEANNITANANTSDLGNGVHALALSGGRIGNFNLTNSTFTGNSQQGVFIQGQNNSWLTASVQNTVMTGNAQHGIAVYDDTSGTFEVDLGGGGRSVGRNVLSGNTLEDLALDYDGRTISAMGNWWGQASGPDQDAPNVGIRPQIYYGAPINNGLVGHWTMDTEWTSGTTIYDRSGNGYNGVLQGGMTLLANQVSGTHRQAMLFDGVNDWINMGDVLDMGTNDFSIVAMANTTSIVGGNNNGVVYKKSTAQIWNTSYGLNMPNGSIRFQMGDGTDSVNVSRNVGYNDGQWHQLSAVIDAGNTVTMFGDGVQQGATGSAASVDNIDSAQNFGIGGRGAASHPFTGMIDDVRVYNRTLTADEVAELYRMDTSSVVDFGGFMTVAP